MNKDTFSGSGLSILSIARKLGCYVSLLLVGAALIGILTKGLNVGLDFTGGYLTEFSVTQSFEQHEIQSMAEQLISPEVRVNSAENGTRWTIRQADISGVDVDREWMTEFASKLNTQVTPLDAVYIGSQVGDELRDQGGLAILVAAIAIMLYLWIRFEWRLATGALLALVHDVLIVLGIFAWLQVPFDLTVLAAILAIIGYSLNDSIVVGDRIRELLRIAPNRLLDDNINVAIKTTFSRTLITSGTTLATISSVWILAGQPLQSFSIALFIGVMVGSLSSITLSATLPQLFGLNAQHYLQEEVHSEEPC